MPKRGYLPTDRKISPGCLRKREAAVSAGGSDGSGLAHARGRFCLHYIYDQGNAPARTVDNVSVALSAVVVNGSHSPNTLHAEEVAGWREGMTSVRHAEIG